MTPEEVERFHHDGYLVKHNVFDRVSLEPIRAAISEIVQQEATALQREGKLDRIFEDVPFERQLALIHRNCPEAGMAILREIMGKGGGGYSGPAMLNMLRHQPLVDCVAALVGPDIVGSSVYRIRPKLPFWKTGAVPWHQDSGYLLAHCDRELCVTCWIPLVDATKENGCLYVIPKVHKQGILQHYTGGPSGYLVIPEDLLPQIKPVCIEMPAGAVLFMTNHTPHASFENTSDHIRWSLDLRYQSKQVPNNIGVDPSSIAPEQEPVTMACYPTEADFTIRDTQHPEREIRTPEAFEALRKRYETVQIKFPGRGWKPLASRE